MPMTSMWKSLIAGLATPRIAALRPGQSPPLVRMPMHFAFATGSMLMSFPSSFSARRAMRTLNAYANLPKMRCALHVFERRLNFVKLKHPIDDGPHLVQRDRAIHRLEHLTTADEDA